MQHMTRAEFQRASGRTRGEVDRLIAAGLPHEQVGSGRGGEVRIPREAALAWFAAIVLDAKDEPGSSPELTRERTRLAKEQADKLAMENAVARRELLRAEDVLKADEIVFTGLRDRVLHVASVAPLLVDAAASDGLPKVRELLRQALVDALEEVGSAELVPVEAA